MSFDDYREYILPLSFSPDFEEFMIDNLDDDGSWTVRQWEEFERQCTEIWLSEDV